MRSLSNHILVGSPQFYREILGVEIPVGMTDGSVASFKSLRQEEGNEQIGQIKCLKPVSHLSEKRRVYREG